MKHESGWTIGEAAALAGVSVRTLRHYDQIGLLGASHVTRAGYRLYDEAAMRRLEQILYFKELGFALDEIRIIMDSGACDTQDVMRRQKELLLLKRERLDRMIARLDEAMRGEGKPRPEVFSMTEIERMKAEYAKEAKERWGNTQAYAESVSRESRKTKEDKQRALDGMEKLMAQFAAVRSLAPQDERVQALVRAWQQHITDNFYTCTDEILAGLGQMYAYDERFKKNIDRHGEGTAACMSAAIAVYTAKSQCAY